MAVKHKKQCQIRLYPEQIDKLKAKIVQDGVTFQKLAEVLFNAYLKNNKEIMKLVKKFSDDNNKKKRRHNTFNEFEAEELLRILETEHSPLKEFQMELEEAWEDED